MKAPCILVVEAKEEDRRLLGEWLEGVGYEDVMFCPGPGAPLYTCVGSHGAACPLSNAADVVIVDLRLRSDEMMAGTPAWQLMLSYYEQGKRIVAISSEAASVRPTPDEQLRVVRRPLERDLFIGAVNAFFHPVYRKDGARAVAPGGEEDHEDQGSSRGVLEEQADRGDRRVADSEEPRKQCGVPRVA